MYTLVSVGFSSLLGIGVQCVLLSMGSLACVELAEPSGRCKYLLRSDSGVYWQKKGADFSHNATCRGV